MTREEAIKILKELQDTYIKCRGEEDIIEVSIDSVDIESLDMAIKALEQEPTTKNDDLSDCISRKFMRDLGATCIAYRNEKQKLIPIIGIDFLPSVTPQLSSGLDKNSKKLEKDFGESDCISRAQAQTKIEINASRYSIAKERGGWGQVEWSDQLIKVSDAVDIIRNLPSVTPQEPIEKCKWIKYDHRTLCPKEHDADNPYWRIPENRMETLKYCPYCGKEIEVEK